MDAAFAAFHDTDAPDRRPLAPTVDITASWPEAAPCVSEPVNTEQDHIRYYTVIAKRLTAGCLLVTAIACTKYGKDDGVQYCSPRALTGLARGARHVRRRTRLTCWWRYHESENDSAFRLSELSGDACSSFRPRVSDSNEDRLSNHESAKRGR